MKHVTALPILASVGIVTAYVSSYGDLIGSFPSCYETCATQTYSFLEDNCGNGDIDCICRTWYCEAGRQPEFDYVQCESENCSDLDDRIETSDMRIEFDTQCRDFMSGTGGCEYLNEESDAGSGDDGDDTGDSSSDEGGAMALTASFTSAGALAMFWSVMLLR